MGRLEYDSGAFAFFFLALWLAVLVPFTYSSVKQFLASQKPPVLLPVPSESSLGKFPATLVANKNKAAIKERAAAQTTSVKSLAFVALGWSLVLAYLFFLSDAGMSEIAHFDPFEILGISNGASDIQIKKAYKKLSLVYHPDRCTSTDKAGKALCETKFVMVAKAYEALTDPVAKENFERYGNPDGRQALEMSIGLPKWLLESENQTWVIASYLLLCLVIFPTSVMLLTWNAAKEGEKLQKRVYADTEEVFRFGVRNGTGFAHFMELFCLAAEFRPFTFRDEAEKKFLLDLRNDLVREDRFPQPSKIQIAMLKQGLTKTEGNDKMSVLLAIHLHRLHDRLIDAQHVGLLEDLERMLIQSPVLLRSLVSHARVTCNFHVLYSAIMFQQYFNQAIVPGPASVIKMLPHVGDDVPAFASKVCPKLREPGLNLEVLLTNATRKPEQDRVALFDRAEMDKEFQEALLDLPFREADKSGTRCGTLKDEIKTKLSSASKRQAKDIDFVFEPESYQGDLVRVVAHLKRRIQRQDTRGNRARTPFLPHQVKEEWYFAVTGGPQPKGFINVPSDRDIKIVQFSAVDEDPALDVLVCDLPFGTAFNQNDWMNTADFPLGTNKMWLHCFSNVYPGLESRCEIDLTLLDPAKMPKYKHHAEDLTLEKEGLSLYSLLQPQNDNDEEDSDFEEGTGKSARRGGRGEEDDDDDDGDEGEDEDSQED